MSKLAKAQHQQGHSKTFFEYIKAIGECKSKQEEDKIVLADLADLKVQLANKKKSGEKDKLAKEYVVRTFYAEMLGHSAEFGHIYCVNIASSTDLLFKRTGYLATWLTVNPEHEFMYLVVASLQRDMKSSSFLEVSVALTAAAKLVKPELMSALNADILSLVKHTSPFVRKRVAGCMHAFWTKSDGAIGDHKEFRQILCDKDPSVMGACLAMYHDICRSDPDGQRDLLPSFISILTQIVGNRLSRDYCYHGVPAPWMQIQLLKIIAVLAADDEVLSLKCTDVIIDTMKRADNSLNIGYAIIYEAINTATSLHPVPQLIEAAAEFVAKFLTSQNANFKYLGITALSKIVKINAKYAMEHQGIVIDCLEHSDDTIRRKTLSLLFAMCTEDNVEAIVARLTKFLAQSTDRFQREELVRNITNLAELYSPSNEWYIETLNKVIELAAEHVTQTTIQGMLKLIAEGTGDDEAEDAQFRTACVENYFDLVESPDKKLPLALYQIVAWVLGEYGFLTRRVSRSMIIDRLCDMIDRVEDAETKGWIVTALMKVVAHNGSMPDNVEDIIVKLTTSRNVALQQRCYEFLQLAHMLPLLKKCLPLDGCCEEIEVDEGLSFLDSIVDVALKNGALPYKKKEEVVKVSTELRMDAYKRTEVDVVNEDDLDKDKFEADEPQLVVREKRWGAKNLENEAAVDRTMPDLGADSGVAGGSMGHGETPSGSHVDPMSNIPEARKPTKNEKFFSDILGGGGGGKSRKAGAKKTGSRAEEAARRAALAEAETAGMTLESYQRSRGVSDTPNSGAAVPTAAPPAMPGPSPAAPAAGAPKVDIDVRKNLTADSLMVRFGVLSSAPLRNVSIAITPAATCAVDCKSADDTPATVNGSTVVFAQATPGKPLFALARVRGLDFPTSGSTVSATITYESQAGPGTKQGSVPLGLIDLLRPLQMSTEDFGKAWPTQAANEVRVQLKFPANVTPEKLAAFLQKGSINLNQVIKNECIAAARIIPAGPTLLVHMVVNANLVNTSIRCTSKEFASAIAQTLSTAAANAAA